MADGIIRSINLKKCPFCGKEADFKQQLGLNNETLFTCGCSTKGCRGGIALCPKFGNLREMARRWNTRFRFRKTRMFFKKLTGR